MAETNKICGRAGIYSHLYGFNGDPNRVPPFCGVAERVMHNSEVAPAVLIDSSQNGELVSVMEIVQDEYAVSLLGQVEAFKGTCLEICGRCPFKIPALSKDQRPASHNYRVYDAKQKINLFSEFVIDPLIIEAVEEEACFQGEPVICQPEFAVVTVPGLALDEVRIGRRRYRESFLGVLSKTLRSSLVDMLLYHTYYSNGSASLAHYDIAKKIEVF